MLGSAPLDGSGQATVTVLLTPGGHALSAVFTGDGTFATEASESVSQVIADQPVAEVTGRVRVSLGRLKRRGILSIGRLDEVDVCDVCGLCRLSGTHLTEGGWCSSRASQRGKS